MGLLYYAVNIKHTVREQRLFTTDIQWLYFDLPRFRHSPENKHPPAIM